MEMADSVHRAEWRPMGRFGKNRDFSPMMASVVTDGGQSGWDKSQKSRLNAADRPTVVISLTYKFDSPGLSADISKNAFIE